MKTEAAALPPRASLAVSGKRWSSRSSRPGAPGELPLPVKAPWETRVSVALGGSQRISHLRVLPRPPRRYRAKARAQGLHKGSVLTAIGTATLDCRPFIHPEKGKESTPAALHRRAGHTQLHDRAGTPASAPGSGGAARGESRRQPQLLGGAGKRPFKEKSCSALIARALVLS